MSSTQECPACGATVPANAKFCPECGAPFGDLTNLEGRTLAGKYEIQKRIGEGSMGQIYLAMHIGLEKRVAIKVLHRDVELGLEASQRFRREGIAAGQIQHRNAIEVFDFDTTEDGLTFLAMEFVEGRDLRQLLDEEGALPFEDASAIILQVLAALQAAHSLGIVHRDLKPANIMLADGTDRLKVKVLDFGLSKLVHRKIEASLTTIPGRIIGTPLYMAPEQSSGEEADARADLYAIGLIFYELLVGERPYTGKTLTELLYAQATEPVPLVSEECEDPDLPEHMDAFFQRALHRDREERFQSAQGMVAALLGDEGVEAPEDDRPRRAAGAGRRRQQPAPSSKTPLLVGAGALVLVAGGAVWALTAKGEGGSGDGPAQPPAPQQASADTPRPGDDAPRWRERRSAARPEGASQYLARLDEAKLQLASGDLAAAESAANAAFLSDLRDPEAFLVRALVYRAKGDLPAAVRDLEEAVKRDAGYTAASVELGWTRVQTGDAEAASAAFGAVPAGDSAYADAQAGLGRLAFDRGDVDAATAAFAAAIEANTECWRAHEGRARLAMASGDMSDAISAFEEARSWKPNERSVLMGLAGALLGDGDPGGAADQYEAALQLDRDDLEALRGYAAAALRDERTDDARDAIERFGREGEPDRAVTLLSLAEAYGDGRLGELRASLADIERSDPDRALKLVLRASLESQEGDHEAALATAERALRVDRDLAAAHYQCAVAKFGLGRYTQAAESCTQAVNLDGDFAEAHLMLGVLKMDFLVESDGALDHLLRYYDVMQDDADPRVEDWIAELQDGR